MPVLLPIFARNESSCVRSRMAGFYLSLILGCLPAFCDPADAAETPPISAGYYHWTGLYIGTNAGYGFGMPVGGGPDVFIGIGALQRSNLDRLESGQHVRMYVRPGKKGPMAVRIEILAQAQPQYDDRL